MSAGRQLVDGVSGARPGSRSGGRLDGRLEGRLPRLEGLGRWVENKLNWILEDEDDWREPWQEQSVSEQPVPERPSRRRPLEARSRRSAVPTPADWPDDSSFTVPRWQRPASRPSAAQGSERSDLNTRSGRALPRSSRRRPAE